MRTAAESYDRLAAGYDAMYVDPVALDENEQVARWLDGPHLASERVLDVGCGTGLVLDLLPGVKPEQYLGVDPSWGMLQRLGEKHPAFAEHTLHADLETAMSVAGYLMARSADLIVSTFGSPSYVDPAAISRLPSLLAPGGRIVLMFYAPGYLPEYDRAQPVLADQVLANAMPALAAGMALPNARATEWHNFVVVTATR